jgi:hypothetical protein
MLACIYTLYGVDQTSSVSGDARAPVARFESVAVTHQIDRALQYDERCCEAWSS